MYKVAHLNIEEENKPNYSVRWFESALEAVAFADKLPKISDTLVHPNPHWVIGYYPFETEEDI